MNATTTFVPPGWERFIPEPRPDTNLTDEQWRELSACFARLPLQLVQVGADGDYPK